MIVQRKINLLYWLVLFQFQHVGATSRGNQCRRCRTACSTWCPAVSTRNPNSSLCNRALYFMSRAAGGEQSSSYIESMVYSIVKTAGGSHISLHQSSCLNRQVLVTFFIVIVDRHRWTRRCYGRFCPAINRDVPFPREDVWEWWRARSTVHPRGPVLGHTCQQLWSHDAQWLLAGVLQVCYCQGAKVFAYGALCKCGYCKEWIPVSTVRMYQQHSPTSYASSAQRTGREVGNNFVQYMS